MTRTPVFNNPLPESTDLIKRQDVLDLSNNMENKAMAASQYDGNGAVKAAGGIAGYVSAVLAEGIARTVYETIYHVGAWYFSDSPIPPADRFGFGTWVRIKGKSPIGVDETDADFGAPKKTGGTKSVALASADNGPHIHASLLIDVSTVRYGGSGSGDVGVNMSGIYGINGATGSSVRTSESGSGTPHNNMHPFDTTYIWRRTA